MGNGVSSRHPHPSRSLIFWEDGKARNVAGRRRFAGEIMAEFPNHLVCHADSFYIGHPIPVLGADSELCSGETYFVLPADHIPRGAVLSLPSLAAFRGPHAPKGSPIDFGVSPFKYLKGVNEDGGVVIKVSPEFIAQLMSADKYDKNGASEADSAGSFLCSTPELRKHYDQLVGSAKGREWSPKLETVPEIHEKNRSSPCGFIGMERKELKIRRVKFL